MIDKSKHSKKKIRILFIVLFVLIMAYAVFMCNKKEGYYIDEPWTYGLANSYYQPFLQDYEGYMENWHDGNFFLKYLETDSNSVFSYDSVFYNQKNDVHPPMYYCLLHTVCSFFPNSYSKWYALSINLILFALELIILYKLSQLLLGKDHLISLIPVVLFGINAGTLSMVVYIRMYLLAVMLATLFVYLSCLIISKLLQINSEDEFVKTGFKLWIGIALTITCGVLSHYFFVILCGMVGFFIFIYMILKKYYKTAFTYAASGLFGGMTALLIFPEMLQHITGTKHSNGAMSNMKHLSITWIIDRIKSYFFCIAAEWTGSAVLLFIFLIVCSLLLLKHLVNKERRNESFLLYLLITVVSLYFILVSLIVLETTDRYQFYLYPFVSIILTKLIADTCSTSTVKSEILISTILAGLSILLALTGTVNYMYPGYDKALYEMSTTYKNVPAFYVCKGDHLIINDCLFVGQQNAVYPIPYEKLDEIPKILEESEHDDSDGLIVYAEIYWNEEETAQKIAEITGLTVDHLIYDNTYTQIYYLR